MANDYSRIWLSFWGRLIFYFTTGMELMATNELAVRRWPGNDRQSLIN